MLQQIEELLSAPITGDAAPTLARMEDALTDGYAQALALEAERWRLERRLGEVARTGAGPEPDADATGFADEISHLATRITSADGELTHLRRLLHSLSERARSMRRAAHQRG